MNIWQLSKEQKFRSSTEYKLFFKNKKVKKKKKTNQHI